MGNLPEFSIRDLVEAGGTSWTQGWPLEPSDGPLHIWSAQV